MRKSRFTSAEIRAHKKFLGLHAAVLRARCRAGAPHGVVLALERRLRAVVERCAPDFVAECDLDAVVHCCDRFGFQPGAALLRGIEARSGRRRHWVRTPPRCGP